MAFALGNLQERAQMFVTPGDHGVRGDDRGRELRGRATWTSTSTKEKKLTNMRTTASDENVILEPPRQITLEYALEYIEEDELIEVTPKTDPAPQAGARRRTTARRPRGPPGWRMRRRTPDLHLSDGGGTSCWPGRRRWRPWSCVASSTTRRRVRGRRVHLRRRRATKRTSTTRDEDELDDEETSTTRSSRSCEDFDEEEELR